MGRVLLGTALLALAIGASVVAFRIPDATYSDGYRYGKESVPAEHLSVGSGTDGAEAECGEHADSDGIAVSDEWFRGCADGALGLPAAE